MGPRELSDHESSHGAAEKKEGGDGESTEHGGEESHGEGEHEHHHDTSKQDVTLFLFL